MEERTLICKYYESGIQLKNTLMGYTLLRFIKINIFILAHPASDICGSVGILLWNNVILTDIVKLIFTIEYKVNK